MLRLLVLAVSTCLTVWAAPPRLGGVSIREHGSDQGHWKFIVPNEIESRVWVPYLEGAPRGTLISVGTFRTLNDAIHGDFSTVIMLDYVERTTRFNRANLKLIAASKDRFEYLVRLFARRPSPELLADARAGRISEERFVEELRTSPRMPESSWTKEQRATLNQVDPPDFRRLRRERGRMQSLQLGLERSIASFARSPEHWRATYWGTDAGFEKLKAMIAARRIVPVIGDLAGRGTMTDLARALKTMGEPVAVLDLSNALDYIVDHEGRKRGAGFVRNLERLPWAPDARVLFTHRVITPIIADRLGNQVFDMDWLYYVTSGERFLSAARGGTFTAADPTNHFYAGLQEMSLPQPRDNALLVVTESLGRESCPTKSHRLLTQP